jgi:hypothetical protein
MTRFRSILSSIGALTPPQRSLTARHNCAL